MKYSIVEFSSPYREYIRILNEEWLSKYFTVEASDKVQLADPEIHILDKGGYICFAKMEDGTIAGTGALMQVEPGVFELSKMAVTESHQGKGIGRAIAVHCIEEARRRECHTLMLYTNSRLMAAIHLYETLGFSHVELGSSPYARGDTRMSMNLSVRSPV